MHVNLNQVTTSFTTVVEDTLMWFELQMIHIAYMIYIRKYTHTCLLNDKKAIKLRNCKI